MAWLEIEYHYKHHIINKLSDQQFKTFIKLFKINQSKAEFIITKKYYNLFDSLLICQYEIKYMRKIDRLTKLTNIYYIQKLLLHINIGILNLVNEKNIKLLLKFIDYKTLFENRLVPINWGPGNHESIDINIEKHYCKHILSSEGFCWKEIISDLSLKSYRDYAINSFYSMSKVIVHTDGSRVYLSGFVGNIFIIGRFHGDSFGLSSCYYVESGEKPGRMSGLCFNLNF